MSVILCLMMSDDTGDGDGLLWQRQRTHGQVAPAVFRDAGGLWAPPISGRGSHRRPQPERRGDVCQDCVHSAGSLLISFLVCCCIVLRLRSYCELLHVTELLPEPLFQACVFGW